MRPSYEDDKTKFGPGAPSARVSTRWRWPASCGTVEPGTGPDRESDRG